MTRARIGVLVLTAAVFGLSAMWRGVGPKVFAQACAISSLTGMARTMDGKVLEGVAVSARAVDRSVTTSVFTDERGEYVFPPLDGGRYQVWAQRSDTRRREPMSPSARRSRRSRRSA
jgi:hypothetical protein